MPSGWNHSDETKKRISESRKGKPSGMKGKKLSDETKKLLSERRKGKNNGMYGKTRVMSEETKRRMSMGSKHTIKKIKNKYPIFFKEEEIRYDPKNPKEKEIQCHCKYSGCINSKEKDGWFTPNSIQLSERIRQLENPDGNGGSYFYCSDICKKICLLYNNREHLRKHSSEIRFYTESEYQIFREQVLERDNYKCQYCGQKAEHVHHERPKKLEPFFSLDPDLAWSVCEKCHYKKGHTNECSTSRLANKQCNK